MRKLIGVALFAGLCGGLAEMGWITLYSSASTISAVGVAREITATIFATAAYAPWAPLAGIGIHLALSAVLGLTFLFALLGFSRTAPTGPAVWIASVIALTCIWAINFFWVLPVLNPAFVTLMPYAVTLASKMLFAIAMAGVLQFTVTVDAKRRGSVAVRPSYYPIKR